MKNPTLILLPLLFAREFSCAPADPISEFHSKSSSEISAINPFAVPGGSSFEDGILSGLQFLRSNGVGPAFSIRSLQALPRQIHVGSRRPDDFTKLVITMEDISRTTVAITKNYETPRRIWSAPERMPSSPDPLVRLLQLWEWQDVTINFKNAMQRVAATGQRGPYRYIQLIKHPNVGGGAEPFYSFQLQQDDSEPVWVGARTGDILNGGYSDIADIRDHSLPGPSVNFLA